MRGAGVLWRNQPFLRRGFPSNIENYSSCLPPGDRALLGGKPSMRLSKFPEGEAEPGLQQKLMELRLELLPGWKAQPISGLRLPRSGCQQSCWSRALDTEKEEVKCTPKNPQCRSTKPGLMLSGVSRTPKMRTKNAQPALCFMECVQTRREKHPPETKTVAWCSLPKLPFPLEFAFSLGRHGLGLQNKTIYFGLGKMHGGRPRELGCSQRVPPPA